MENTTRRTENGEAAQPLSVWAKVSAVYLFLPWMVFAAGWLNWWIALPLLACMVCSLRAMLAGWKFGGDSHSIPTHLGIGGIAVAFALMAGLFDCFPQSPDQLKHNLIFGDLIEKSWPVRYSENSGGGFLCYGLGYYLIPSALAKLIGTHSLGILSGIWAVLGLWLSLVWVARGFSKHPMAGILAFLLCSGLGAFWFLIKGGLIQNLLMPGLPAAWNGGELMDLGLYTSNLDSFTRIHYQPQHGIVAWLGGALLYDLLIVRKRWTEAASVWAATLFWSPLTSLGLAVIGLTMMICHPGLIKLRPVIHLPAALAMTGVMAAYLLPHVPIAEKGFIWEMTDGWAWGVWYLAFVLLFAGIPVSSIAWMEKKHAYLGPLKPVVIGMTVVLILSPLFKMGQFGDLRMQISGTAFFFIALAMAKGLVEPPQRGISAARVYLGAVFLAGAAFPLVRSVENLISAEKTDYRIVTLRKNHLASIRDLRMPGFDVTTQYLGNADSWTARLILKPSAAGEDGPLKNSRHD